MAQQETRSVTVEEMAAARESRAAAQMTLLSRHKGAVVVCLTMNIAGPIKRTERFDRAFDEGERAVRAILAPHKTHFAHAIREKTGCEAIFCVEGDEIEIKRRLCVLEDSTPIGRLWDIDVLYGSGEKISRADMGFPPRKCLLCDQDAPVCARSRAHSLSDLLQKTNDMIDAYFEEEMVRHIALHAQRALLTEVAVTPKPGLVDRENNGAHSDMDVFTFIDSACALRDYFESCVRLGIDHRKKQQSLSNANQAPDISAETYEKLDQIIDEVFEELGDDFLDNPSPAPRFPLPQPRTRQEISRNCFAELRAHGLLAEAAMREATNGVNTHKGAIFSLGIFCAALGMTIIHGRVRSAFAFIHTRIMTSDALKTELFLISHLSARTFGEQYYQTTLRGGAREEAANGFPSVRFYAQPRLKEALSAGLSLNDAGLCALVALMANVNDTNAAKRATAQGADFMKESAAELNRQIRTALENGTIASFDLVGRMRAFDAELTKKNISPGGCADLLALTLMAYFVDHDPDISASMRE